MSQLSRRHLITSAAALPVLAMPAVASTLAPEPDPIFAAIERYRGLEADTIAADIEWTKALHRADLKAKREQLDIARVRAAGELAEIAPTTTAGAAALVTYVSVDLLDGEAEWHQPALANAARALSGMAGSVVLPALAVVDAAPVDPVFAAIEAYRVANAAYDKKYDELNYGSTIVSDEAAAELDQFQEVCVAAAIVIQETKPTTRDGAMNLLRFADELEREAGPPEGEVQNLRRLAYFGRRNAAALASVRS